MAEFGQLHELLATGHVKPCDELHCDEDAHTSKYVFFVTKIEKRIRQIQTNNSVLI